MEEMEERLLHNWMVRQVAEQLRSEGYTVRAALSPFPSPRLFRGRRPDILATSGTLPNILAEVETPESVGNRQTRAQFQAFAAIPSAEFHVGVAGVCAVGAH